MLRSTRTQGRVGKVTADFESAGGDTPASRYDLVSRASKALAFAAYTCDIRNSFAYVLELEVKHLA